MNRWTKYKGGSTVEGRKIPEHHPAHAGYALLTVFALLAALWQHGEPRYTLVLLLLTVIFSFAVLLPRRFCNMPVHSVLKVLLFGAGCFWCVYRVRADIPFDKAAVETLALWNLTFLTGGSSRDYLYLFFNDLLLLLYAALIPRLFSLYMMIGALGVMILLLFGSRSGFLSGDMLIAAPRGTLRRNWFQYLIYLLLAVIFFHQFFIRMPLTPGTQTGLVPVSFFSGKESLVPPGIKEWLGSGQEKENGPGGKTSEEMKSGNFLTVCRQGKRLLPLKNPPPDMMPVSGKGGGAIGRDLVFRVRSPLKLYHIAQLYDEYDGRIWRVSPAFRNNQLRPQPVDAMAGRVNLVYTIEKWITPKLFSPYLALYYEIDMLKNFVRTSRSFFGAEIVSQLPPLPFNYEVLAEICIPSGSLHDAADRKDPAWRDRLPQRHFLQLPPQRIPRRVKVLARKITEKCTSPYAKAVALRDFLRNNCRYCLHSGKTPENQESSDYFLFHLQEGHCEYFAAALAVLARLNHLPARVATGFSPGNYNTLTGEFEVFEYHAHAWTQIFIPHIGWLTFDAVPPSAVVSETTPLGFGKMRDPFGEEWRIQPPELTGHTIKQLRKALIEEQGGLQEEESNIDGTLEKIAQAGDELREQIRSHHGQPEEQKFSERLRIGSPDLELVRKQMAKVQKKIQRAAASVISWLSEERWRLLVPAVLLVLFAAALRIILLLLRHLLRGFRIAFLHFRARTAPPRKALRCCCLALLGLLDQYHFGRRGNQELIAYAESLPEDLAAHALAIIRAFYRSEYRRKETPVSADAQDAADHLEHLAKLLKSRRKKEERA